MHIFVSPTDHDWYRFLRERTPDEVNFWRPSGGRRFTALEPGEPFLFKAKYPHNAIIGGGFFIQYVSAPVSLAWQAFGENNGTRDIREFLGRVRKYRQDVRSPDPEVGCILLNEPFFFPEELWLEPPADWARQIVSGKQYDTADPVGRRLWDAVVARLADPRAIIGPGAPSLQQPGPAQAPPFGSAQRYGAEYLTVARLGQGAFRLGVLDAYQRRCAVTGERIVPVLEAAHIRPFAAEGPHRISNGLLLRSDIHRLFDLGYVTVEPNHCFRVSRLLDDEFHNGRDYYRLEGQVLSILPDDVQDRPAREYLEWHNDSVFRP